MFSPIGKQGESESPRTDLQLRRCTIKEMKLVLDEYDHGVADRHYVPATFGENHLEQFTKAMQIVLLRGVYAMQGSLREVTRHRAELLVFGKPSDSPLGYALIIDQQPGRWETDLEILMMGIAIQHRQVGLGRLLIRRLIERLAIYRGQPHER